MRKWQVVSGALALCLLAVVRPASAQPAGQHPLTPAVGLAEQSVAAAHALTDYRAVFTKREMVNGRMFASQMEMKYRPRPISVYLRFVNPEHVGREALFVENQNEGKLLAHEAGFKSIVGTVALDPEGDLALSEARHPVTQIGIEKMAEGVAVQWKNELAFGETDVKYYAEAKLGEQPVVVIESRHPTPRRQFKFALTRLWIDKTSKLPVRVQQYAFPTVPGGEPVLVEEYTYTNLQPNVGLTEYDFDVRNRDYAF